MAGLAFGGGAEQRSHIVLALDVGLVCEIQIPAVGPAIRPRKASFRFCSVFDPFKPMSISCVVKKRCRPPAGLSARRKLDAKLLHRRVHGQYKWSMHCIAVTYDKGAPDRRGLPAGRVTPERPLASPATDMHAGAADRRALPGHAGSSGG